MLSSTITFLIIISSLSPFITQGPFLSVYTKFGNSSAMYCPFYQRDVQYMPSILIALNFPCLSLIS